MSDLDRHDTIVIGAGHNGMVCASLLARAGQRVLLLEAADAVGGLAAAREFHSGFRAPVAHAVNHFSPAVAKALDLANHGLRFSDDPPRLVSLSPDGRHIVLSGSKVTGVSDQEARACTDHFRQMQRFADALAPFWLRTIPRLARGSWGDMATFARMGFNLRRLGKEPMREFLRIFSLPSRDLMDERFEDDALKALLSWDALIGSRMAPRSPNNAVLTLLYRMAGSRIGAPGKLVEALRSAAASAGVDIRTAARVAHVRVDTGGSGQRATGIVLESGETIGAERVVSGADPKTTFLDLVGVEHLEIGFTHRIRRLRCRGLVAKLHLALAEAPDFRGLEDAGGRLLVAPGLDAIEFAFDDAKYGRCPKRPVLEITLPSLEDPGLAPPGHHVLSAHVLYVPQRLKNGWNDAERDALYERVMDTLESFAPGIRQTVLGRELLTPADLEKSHGATGGHWHHGEMALDQMLMMRPTYEAAQYATPLPGLYLCGAGSHPGGDLTGAPGYNAAREILR